MGSSRVLVLLALVPAAGSTLIVDDPGWKPATFQMTKEMSLQDTWGYVDPDKYLPLNHHGHDEVSKFCSTPDTFEDKIPMKDYGKLSTVNWYPDTQSFIDFRGIDLIPENAKSYVRGSYHEKRMNFEMKQELYGDENIQLLQCRGKTPEDGGAWHVQRVGPFRSRGNYDWWQMGWQDVAMFSEALAKHPEGIDVDRYILAPVDKNGVHLGHPPIHIHHMHLIAQDGVRPRNIGRVICHPGPKYFGSNVDNVLKTNNCYNSSLFFEQHGDYQCQPEDDGVGCFSQGDERTMRRISEVLDIEGDLNDVRPPDSPEIEWYYQVAMHWTPIKKEGLPTSMVTIMAPAQRPPEDNQLLRVGTYRTPTDKSTFLWYTGHMWCNGELIRNKLHAHNMVFHSSQFYAATPADLGLDSENGKYYPPSGKASDPFYVDELGFADNDAMISWMQANLKKSQATWDEKCTAGGHKKLDICTRRRPYMVSAAIYDGEEYEFDFEFGKRSFSFDRRPKTYSTAWNFKKGEQFIVTGFSRALSRPPKPDKPLEIPETIPSHVTWGFWHVRHGWFHSYFSRVVCSQTRIFFDAHTEYTISQMAGAGIASRFYGSVPSKDFVHDVAVWIPAAVLVMFSSTVAYGVHVSNRAKKLS